MPRDYTRDITNLVTNALADMGSEQTLRLLLPLVNRVAVQCKVAAVRLAVDLRHPRCEIDRLKIVQETLEVTMPE